MRKNNIFILGFFCVAGTLWGCSQARPNVGSNDSTQATEADGRDTGTVAENVAFRAFTASFGSPGAALTLDDATGALILEHLKSALSAVSASNCVEGDLPSPSGNSVTINGSTGGSCATAYSGDASSGVARANCSNYNDGSSTSDAAVDGLIGVEGSATTSGTQSDFQFNSVTSRDLVLTLADGDNCSAVLNLSADVTIDNDTGSGSASVTGCVKICGEAFDVTGSEVF